MLFGALFTFLPLLVTASSVPHSNSIDDGHSHVGRGALPKRWYQDEDHPVHRLFRRATDDGIQYPAVGTSSWSAPFPRGSPDPQFLPEAWKNALDAAVAEGRIPDTPRTRNTPQTNPVYPPGVDPSSLGVCSSTYKCRHPDVIWDAPDGVFASSFDDGPYPSSGPLVDFLAANNATTTHFMIGVHILANPGEFLRAFEADNDIAVHTWTHPYMTTLSNSDIAGQLGWTMQLIHHSTGGRVPRYWRPPYGDADTRVYAIAKEVFGLETVIWNVDTHDWGLAAGEITPEAMTSQIEGWLQGPKAPGIMMLQHEVTDLSVSIFMDIFPLIQQHGWRYGSLAQVMGDGRAYQNADSSSSDDVTFKVVYEQISSGSPSSSSSPSSSARTLSSHADIDTGGLTPTPTVNSNSAAQPSIPAEGSANSLSALRSWRGMVLFALPALLLL